MIVIPASLRSDFIHIAGMTIHIALESTIHIVGIRTRSASVTTPHDLKIQEQVFEAVATVEHIFRKRGIYAQVNPDA